MNYELHALIPIPFDLTPNLYMQCALCWVAHDSNFSCACRKCSEFTSLVLFDLVPLPATSRAMCRGSLRPHLHSHLGLHARPAIRNGYTGHAACRCGVQQQYPTHWTATTRLAARRTRKHLPNSDAGMMSAHEQIVIPPWQQGSAGLGEAA